MLLFQPFGGLFRWRVQSASPVGVKGSVSAAESSLHVLGIFLHITAKRQNKATRSPFPAQSVPGRCAAGGHGSFCGSGVQFCGQPGVHGALLCLIGGHGLIRQCGALAVGGQNGTHLADDALHFPVVGRLHRVQSAASCQHDGDLARCVC